MPFKAVHGIQRNLQDVNDLQSNDVKIEQEVATVVPDLDFLCIVLKAAFHVVTGKTAVRFRDNSCPAIAFQLGTPLCAAFSLGFRRARRWTCWPRAGASRAHSALPMTQRSVPGHGDQRQESSTHSKSASGPLTSELSVE